MKYAVVMPSIYPPYAEECLATCKFENILVVDNTVKNLGVAASWNKGIDYMHKINADWLILMSASMRFGPPGGLDFIEHLEQNPDAHAIAATDIKGGWHLIALSRKTIDTCGRFDQNFYPAELEDIDYATRMLKAFPDFNHPKFGIEAYCKSVAHGRLLAGVIKYDNHDFRVKYILKKWGDISNPLWDYPFNDPKNPLTYWPDSADGGKCDG